MLNQLTNRIALVLFFLFAVLFADAQWLDENSKRVLERISTTQQVRETENYRKAYLLSKSKGWELTRKGKDGRMAYLVGMDEKGMPVYLGTESNVNAAVTIGTSRLWAGGASGLNLSGAADLLKDKLAIWDGGRVMATHVELSGRVTQKDNPADAEGHSTHVAGTMIATGLNPQVKGMAHGIKGILAYDFNGHLSEMAAAAPSLLVSNHSYGTLAGWQFNDNRDRWEFYGLPNENEDYKFGWYSSEAQIWDSIAYASPHYLIVKAAGNNRNESGPDAGTNYWRYNDRGVLIDAGPRPTGISDQSGYDLLATYSTAKNALVVGNVRPIPGGYTKPTDVVLNPSSSVGPTDDGRIKPDVVANGTSVRSTYNGTDNAYATLSGTSMSSPTVAGSAILLQELYMQKNNNNPAWSATLRGVVIHTTDKASVRSGPDYQHGWGLANFSRAAEVINKATGTSLEQRSLQNKTTYSTTVVASGKGPLKVTICWTDPAGKRGEQVLNDRTRRLVNDLDIRIKKDTVVYMPYVLDVNFPGTPATKGDNNVDNVEQIEIEKPIPGASYVIEISHKDTITSPTGKQDYALIMSGIGGSAYATSSALQTAGSKIDTLSFAGINLSATAGCTKYTDLRTTPSALEVGDTAAFYFRTASCDATNGGRFAKLFFDFNQDGDFDDAGELAATSASLSNGGVFSGRVPIPQNLAVGSVLVARLVMAEAGSASDLKPTATYSNGETMDMAVSIVNPSNDMLVKGLVNLQTGDCSSGAKYVTVTLSNVGSKPQSDFPLTLELRKGNNLVSTTKGFFKGSINGSSESEYTFQQPIVLDAAANYAVKVTSDLKGDQQTANNTYEQTISVAPLAPAPVNGEGVNCNGNNVILQAQSSVENARLTWFSTPTAPVPFAQSTSGTSVSSTVTNTTNKYYVAINDLSASVGPQNKNAWPSGGYNEFFDNFVRFSNTVPVSIESARMYIGNPGKMRIVLGDLSADEKSYFILGAREFNVTNTRPTPMQGAVTVNDPLDSGAVFNLNFQNIPPGNHILLMQCTEGATVYRSNEITTNPYPVSIAGGSNAFSVTGNSVPPATDDFRKFYYFYYDMRVSISTGCPSARTEVTVNPNAVPVASSVGDTVRSSIAAGNQWQLNGADIAAANTQTYKVTQSGSYRTVVTDKYGCATPSNAVAMTVTSINNLDPEKIGLAVSPNPSNGIFSIQFSTTTVGDLDIAVLNATGQQVYNRSKERFMGSYKGKIDLENTSPGIYFLRVRHGINHYIKKLLIR